mmetsp:Transcript_12747/g.16644  ORF Transcript_12747/g.16644 Transcript_12747/m.16644 type:complete len:487 (-) Transcript_12747:65-1525(-)
MTKLPIIPVLYCAALILSVHVSYTTSYPHGTSTSVVETNVAADVIPSNSWIHKTSVGRFRVAAEVATTRRHTGPIVSSSSSNWWTWNADHSLFFQKGSRDAHKKLRGIWVPVNTTSTHTFSLVGYEKYSTHKEAWEQRYSELITFQEEYGHCDVPVKYVPNPKLANWVQRQRRLYRKGQLKEYRLCKLNEVGIVWDVQSMQWNQCYEELLLFREKYGHCDVPQSYKKLGRWVMGQRRQKRIGKLSQSRLTKLNEVGMFWEQDGNTWEDGYKMLLKFKEMHGNCLVPNKYERCPTLARWVRSQRASYRRFVNGEKSVGITYDQIQKLKKIGFHWNDDSIQSIPGKQQSWYDTFESLCDFRRENGHCFVPNNPANASLYKWVLVQRKRLKNPSIEGMQSERARLLKSIHFVWDVNNYKWSKCYMRLKSFREKHGHCAVPASFPDTKLKTWIANQRAILRKHIDSDSCSEVSRKRINQLNDIGFIWTVR